MKIIDENFEHLHFSESCLGVPIVRGNDLFVPVSGLYVMSDHPLAVIRGGPFKGVMKFISVSSSSRNIAEYIDGSRSLKGFRDPYDVFDGPFPSSKNEDKLNEYGFEGFLEEPEAWVNDWVVHAKHFIFECED